MNKKVSKAKKVLRILESVNERWISKEIHIEELPNGEFEAMKVFSPYSTPDKPLFNLYAKAKTLKELLVGLKSIDKHTDAYKVRFKNGYILTVDVPKS